MTALVDHFGLVHVMRKNESTQEYGDMRCGAVFSRDWFVPAQVLSVSRPVGVDPVITCVACLAQRFQ